MNKEDLIEYQNKINNLSEEELKQRNIYLKNIANGTIQGPSLKEKSIIKPSLKYFTDEEAYLASNYLVRYPHIYYNNYLRFMYGVSECKPIEKPTDEIREIIWEYCRAYQRRFVGSFF